MVVGEAPGEEEDRRGKPWQGKVGRWLQRFLRTNYKLDLFRDCICINSVNCRPPKNRVPSPQEVACCRRRVLRVIEEHRPTVIVLLGGSAVESLVGHRFHEGIGAVSRWRGWVIPDGELGAWLCPTFHPSYVMRNEEQRGRNPVETLYRQDWAQIMAQVGVAAPVPRDWGKGVTLEADPRKARKWLTEHRKTPDVAFDYETTGIKPHAAGHRIVCCSISVTPDEAFVFPVNKYTQGPLGKVLTFGRSRKYAHNIAFEDTWSRVRLGVVVQGWWWDSMQAAHILDNRPGITGLKFQSAVHFGVWDYDSHLQQYIKGAGGGNDFNRIDEAPLDEVMEYCGMDTMLQFNLSLSQIGLMGVGNRI
jgi:uracil-DNA glycosylase family 4